MALAGNKSFHPQISSLMQHR